MIVNTDTKENAPSLEERIGGIAGVDEDIAEVLAANWQRLLGCLVITLLATWLIHEYRVSKQREAEEASLRFAQVGMAYNELTKDPEGNLSENILNAKADAERALNDNLSMLKSAYGGSSYYGLARLYEVQSEIERGNFDSAKQVAYELGAKWFIDSNSEINPQDEILIDDLVREVSALQYVRIIISNSDQLDDARNLLTKIISKSKVVNMEALIVLARISVDNESKEKLKTSSRELISMRPELAESIQNELSTLGIVLN